ncbi:hypothetical protein T06_15075 [Trichinella sp. T6]|nr:hypothetical protein T06_15075 [Trichinella sp. T6]
MPGYGSHVHACASDSPCHMPCQYASKKASINLRVVIHTSSTSLSTYQPSPYLRQQWSFCADVVDLQIVESIVRSLCEIVMCNSAARALVRYGLICG